MNVLEYSVFIILILKSNELFSVLCKPGNGKQKVSSETKKSKIEEKNIPESTSKSQNGNNSKEEEGSEQKYEQSGKSKSEDVKEGDQEGIRKEESKGNTDEKDDKGVNKKNSLYEWIDVDLKNINSSDFVILKSTRGQEYYEFTPLGYRRIRSISLDGKLIWVHNRHIRCGNFTIYNIEGNKVYLLISTYDREFNNDNINVLISNIREDGKGSITFKVDYMGFFETLNVFNKESLENFYKRSNYIRVILDINDDFDRLYFKHEEGRMEMNPDIQDKSITTTKCEYEVFEPNEKEVFVKIKYDKNIIWRSLMIGGYEFGTKKIEKFIITKTKINNGLKENSNNSTKEESNGKVKGNRKNKTGNVNGNADRQGSGNSKRSADVNGNIDRKGSANRNGNGNRKDKANVDRNGSANRNGDVNSEEESSTNGSTNGSVGNNTKDKDEVEREVLSLIQITIKNNYHQHLMYNTETKTWEIITKTDFERIYMENKLNEAIEIIQNEIKRSYDEVKDEEDGKDDIGNEKKKKKKINLEEIQVVDISKRNEIFSYERHNILKSYIVTMTIDDRSKEDTRKQSDRSKEDTRKQSEYKSGKTHKNISGSDEMVSDDGIDEVDGDGIDEVDGDGIDEESSSSSSSSSSERVDEAGIGDLEENPAVIQINYKNQYLCHVFGTKFKIALTKYIDHAYYIEIVNITKAKNIANSNNTIIRNYKNEKNENELDITKEIESEEYEFSSKEIKEDVIFIGYYFEKSEKNDQWNERSGFFHTYLLIESLKESGDSGYYDYKYCSMETVRQISDIPIEIQIKLNGDTIPANLTIKESKSGNCSKNNISRGEYGRKTVYARGGVESSECDSEEDSEDKEDRNNCRKFDGKEKGVDGLVEVKGDKDNEKVMEESEEEEEETDGFVKSGMIMVVLLGIVVQIIK